MKRYIAILLVILAVAAVLVAKQMSKQRDLTIQQDRSEHFGDLSSEVRNKLTGKSEANSTTGKTSSLVLSGAEFDECLKSGKPTLVEFGKGTCPTCRKMAPLLAETAENFRNKAHVVSVDLDDYPELGRAHKIMAMPTQVYFDAKGKEVKRNIGPLSMDQLAAELNAAGAE